MVNGGWPVNRGFSEISIIFSRNITLFWNKRATGEAFLIHSWSSTSISDCIFIIRFLKWSHLSVSSAWWRVNRGGNNGRTLVRMDKKGSQTLNRGLISHSFLQLFRDFDNWPFKRGWPLNRGSTVEPKEPPSCLITYLLIALYPTNWNLSDNCTWSALNLS